MVVFEKERGKKILREERDKRERYLHEHKKKGNRREKGGIEC